MSSPQTLYIFLIFLFSGAASQSPLCPYERSVNVTQNLNGYYTYGDLEIPPELVHIYNYTMLENGTKIYVDNYTRGCICNVRRCLRICSNNLLKNYNDSSNIEDIDVGYTKNITLKNGSRHEVHLIRDFHHVVGSVCEQTNSLDPERNAKLEWTMFENGTLLRHGDEQYLGPEEYCFEMKFLDIDNETYFLINPQYCLIDLPWNWSLKAYVMMISIPFFITTIIFYYCLPYLKTVQGKCFISYLSSLALSYILISYIIVSRIEFSPTPCKVLGYMTYYTIIAYLTWACLISYETWNTLTHMTTESSFRKYSMVGWSVPTIMTILIYLAQISHMDEDLKPGIDNDNCGVITTRWSACIYLYVPCIIVLIFSLVLYVQVLRYIVYNKRRVSVYKDGIKKSDRQRFFLYFRLFIFMGVYWFLDILSYFLNMIVNYERAVLSLPDLFNASQGIFIFLMFICRSQVWAKVREKFSTRRTREHRIVNQSCTMEDNL